MKRLASAWVWLLLTASGFGQSLPSFEVASVRPSGPNVPQRSNVPLDAGYVYGTIAADDARSSSAGIFSATHQPLWRYISFAYKLSGTQEMALRFNIYSGVPKSGAPLWVTGSFTGGADFFDINARAPEKTSVDEMRRMMQALLAERFHLVLHMQTAEAPVFALELAAPGRTGPRLVPHSAGDKCGPSASPSANLPPACGVIAHVASDEPSLHYGGRAITMALLATTLPTMTGLAAMPRPVVDQTGLPGQYDFTLSWVHDATPDDSSVADNIGNFRAALKEQLGLTLKSTHAPMAFVVVDHVEKPTEN